MSDNKESGKAPEPTGDDKEAVLKVYPNAEAVDDKRYAISSSPWHEWSGKGYYDWISKWHNTEEDAWRDAASKLEPQAPEVVIFCVDEGCPQFGTKHICNPIKTLARLLHEGGAIPVINGVRIEPQAPTGDNPYRGMKWTDLQKAARQVKAALDAEPQAPDDLCEWNGRVISKFHEFVDISNGNAHRCIKCKKEYSGYMCERSDWGLADEEYERDYKPEPKEPDAIEVEYRYKTSEEAKLLPLPLQLKRLEEINIELCRNHNTLLVENVNLERQLKAEIAAKNQQAEYVAFWKKEAISGNTAIKKAEKERDAALEEVAKLERKVLLQRAYLATSPDKRWIMVTQERDAALEEARQLKLSLPGTSSLYVPKAAYLAIESERDQLKAELDLLKSALATPEVYAEIISENVERENAEVHKLNRELKAELDELRKQK